MESSCQEDQGKLEPQNSTRENTPENDSDADLIFVGVEHVNEDADLIFVGVTSHSRPVVSTILNRVTPGSCSRRKKYRHLSQYPAHSNLQPTRQMTPTAKVVPISPASSSESRSTDSPIIIEPLSHPGYNKSLPQIEPTRPSEVRSPLTRFPGSLQHPGGAVLPVGGVKERPSVPEQVSTSEVNSINPKRPKLSDGSPRGHSSALSFSGANLTKNNQQNTSLKGVNTSISYAQNGAPFPIVFPKDKAHFRPVQPAREIRGLAKTEFSRLASPTKTFSSQEGNLVMLLDDFYYGQHEGDGQPEEKTHTNFKCLSCLKVLKNVKFMNHMKHHLELEHQRGDSWDSHTTCQHCYRPFLTPIQLQRHIERVHISQEPSSVCKICELSFETDQDLLQHMKDTHKPNEMPYVCQVCKYRSSTFRDVETHFRTCHENTKSLLCPFCLKVFKTASPYMCHYTGHIEKTVHQCSKCRLQFLTFKEKMEHKTRCHQMFKKPKQLEGWPPETKVVIQVTLEALQPGSVEVPSVTVSTSDCEPSPLGLKGLPPSFIHSTSGKNTSCKKSRVFQSKSKAPTKPKDTNHTFLDSTK
ncbi:zinc finger protein 280B-like [Tenrec ecaudatus]|uniref:zinc finger protein 280B-like n=1 Tax=Tenrec ecaudatus TaxID=94439 RepID=UPI003F5AB357